VTAAAPSESTRVVDFRWGQSIDLANVGQVSARLSPLRRIKVRDFGGMRP